MSSCIYSIYVTSEFNHIYRLSHKVKFGLFCIENTQIVCVFSTKNWLNRKFWKCVSYFVEDLIYIRQKKHLTWANNDPVSIRIKYQTITTFKVTNNHSISTLEGSLQLREMSYHYSDIIMSMMASQITGISIACSSVCSGTDQRKQKISVSLAFVRGVHQWLVDSPHKGPSNAENVSVWWCDNDHNAYQPMEAY